MTELHFNGNEYDVQNFEVHYTTKPMRRFIFLTDEERWFAPRISMKVEEIDQPLLDAIHDEDVTYSFVFKTELLEYVFTTDQITIQHAESQLGAPHESEMVEMAEIGFKASPDDVAVFVRSDVEIVDE